MWEVLENIGAGEGNRTLVFSLEVSKNCSLFSGRSDILAVFGPLRSLQNFSLSEWQSLAHAHLFQAILPAITNPSQTPPIKSQSELFGNQSGGLESGIITSIELPTRRRQHLAT
jgi:hypothetical protein